MRIFGVDITFRINRASNTNTNHNPHNLSHVERVDIKYKKRDFTLQVIVAIITLALFGISAYQAKVSRDAVNVAKATLDSTNNASRINIELAQKQFNLSKSQFDSANAASAKNEAITNKNIDIAQQNADATLLQAKTSEKSLNEQHKSIDLTIKQFEENKKQFEAINYPFLTIEKVVPIIEEGKPLIIEFDIMNAGNVPAKAVYHFKTLFFTDLTDNQVLNDSKKLFSNTNRVQGILAHITKSSPWQTSGIVNTKPTINDITEFKSGRKDIIMLLDLHYVNQLNKKQSALRAILRVHTNQTAKEIRFGYLYYENEPI